MSPPVLRSGPWDMARVAAFLAEAVIPVRLATVGADGAPLVQSLWFAADLTADAGDDAAVWCATQADAVVVARIGHEPRVAFEIAGDEMPYRGVRGTGVESILDDSDGEVLRRLLGRYDVATDRGLGAWLLSRVDTEVAVRIDDLSMVTWDYSGRMGDG